MSNENCTRCRDCRDCTDCVDCTNCRYCWYCADCTNCTDCTDCTDCTRCHNCTGLTGYEGVYINSAEKADDPRFMEVIAILSTVAPEVWVTNVGKRYENGMMYVNVPKLNK